MKEKMDYEEVKKNPDSVIASVGSEEREKILKEIASVKNNHEKLKMYQDAIIGADTRIKYLDAQIDAADEKIAELRKLLEEELVWKGKIEEAKDNIINEIKKDQMREKDGEGKYDSKGFDRDGIHRETQSKYGPDGFDRDGIHRETQSKYGPDGFDKRGYDSEGYDRDGYSFNNGYNRAGYDREGYNAFGYNDKGENREGEYMPVFDYSDKKQERVAAEREELAKIRAARKRDESERAEREERERERKRAAIEKLRKSFAILREEEERLEGELEGKLEEGELEEGESKGVEVEEDE